MISWTVPTTAQEFSATYSSSSRTLTSGVFSVTNVNNFGETTGRSRTEFTSRSEEGSTSISKGSETRFFSSYFTRSSSATTFGITSSSGFSSSSSSSSTVIFGTVASNFQTSTTSSFSETFVATTSSSNNIATTASTRTRSALATTTISDTYVGESGFAQADRAATIYKAEPGEVLWHIANATTNWSQFSAASALGTTAEQVTVIPFRSFVQMEAAPSSAAISTFSAAASTQAITWTNTTLVSTQSTSVNFNSLPNFTETFEGATTATTTQSASSNIFQSWSFTISGNTQATRKTQSTTRTQEVYGSSIATIQNQIADLTFAETVLKRVSSTRTTTISASQLQSFTYSTISNPTSAGGGTWTITDESNSYWASGGNTTLPFQVITTEAAGQTSANTWWTSGARVGSEVGLFYTANASFAPTEAFTVQDGHGVLAVTLMPTGNAEYTISGNSITTKTGTAATDTMLIEASVSGTEQIAEIASSVENGFGGTPVEKQTIVNKAAAGVYRNLENGQSALFDGNATVYSASSSGAVSKFETLTNVVPAEFSSSVSAIVWPSPRNSTAVPPEL